MRDRIEEGRKALVWLRPTGVDVEDEVNEIRGAVLEDFETKKSVTFWDMFKDPIDRRRTIISICAVCLQGASGSMFIIGKNTSEHFRRLKTNRPKPIRHTSSPSPELSTLSP